MFTGIIESTAEVISFHDGVLKIKRPKQFIDLAKGQSIAVNGACLSVVSFSDTKMCFEVVPETLQKTNLSESKKVNLERAMRANGRFEGHIVLGHVDETITLLHREKEELGEKFTFELPKEFQKYIVQKGSITLNGISLTVADVKENSFLIAIIPHTLKHTNLCDLQAGETVNVETDIFAKYLEKQKK